MPRFLLVRHGQTEWNASRTQQGWLDSTLTEQGIADTQLVAGQLPTDTSLVFTSDLGRAIHSARLIADGLPQEALVLTDWRLRERAYGEMEGQPIDIDEIDRSYHDPAASYRGCEPVSVMDERIKSFIRDCALFDADQFVVIAHNGILSRLGHLFDPSHSHTSHLNSSIIEFHIDYDDPALRPHQVSPWRRPS